MAGVLQGHFPASPYTGLTGASTSYFFKMGMGGGNSTITTESQQTTTQRVAGVWSRAGIYITANSRATAGTLRSRVNAANGNQSVSITATTTGRFEDASNSDTVASGDTFNLAMTNGTGTSALSVNHAYAKFTATSGVSSHLNAEGGSTFPAAGSASTLYRTQPIGSISAAFSTSDTNIWEPCRSAGTLHHFYIVASANTRVTDSTAGVRLNATTNGNQVVTVPASTSGTFEDVTNTDTLTNSTNFAYYVQTGTGAGSLTVRRLGCMFNSNGNYYDSMTAAQSSIARSLNGTNYSRIIGALFYTTTESDAQVRMPFAGRSSHLRVHSQGVNSIVTVKLRKNGVDGNQSVSSLATGSGVYEDTTSHDDFIDTDLLALSWSTASASTSNFSGAGLMIQPPPAPAGSTKSGLLQIVS